MAPWKLRHNGIMPSKTGQKIISNLEFSMWPNYYSIMDNRAFNMREVKDIQENSQDQVHNDSVVDRSKGKWFQSGTEEAPEGLSPYQMELKCYPRSVNTC